MQVLRKLRFKRSVDQPLRASETTPRIWRDLSWKNSLARCEQARIVSVAFSGERVRANNASRYLLCDKFKRDKAREGSAVTRRCGLPLLVPHHNDSDR